MHNFNLFPRSTIANIFNGEYDKRLKELSSDVCAMQNIAKFEKLPTLAVTDKLFTLLRNRVAFVKGVLCTLLLVWVSVKTCGFLSFYISIYFINKIISHWSDYLAH